MTKTWQSLNAARAEFCQGFVILRPPYPPVWLVFRHFRNVNPPSPNDPAVSGSRFLIIDDDRAFCALIRDYLASFGYAVSAAHTEPAGVDAALAEA